MRSKEKEGILNKIIKGIANLIKIIVSLAKTVWKFLPIILLAVAIILIFIASPRITMAIQNGAKFIYELDAVLITRIVEMVLAVTIIGASTSFKKGK